MGGRQIRICQCISRNAPRAIDGVNDSDPDVGIRQTSTGELAADNAAC